MGRSRRIRIIPSDPDVVRVLLRAANRERYKGTMDGHDLARRLEREAVKLRISHQQVACVERDVDRPDPCLFDDDLDPSWVAGRWPPR